MDVTIIILTRLVAPLIAFSWLCSDFSNLRSGHFPKQFGVGNSNE